MAGPGGGPPRRSHTKSRKGCVTCKRRHIRCDETFPQCNNCTKHKIRCPYRDIQVPDAGRMPTPDKPDLMWTPDIERAISDWQRTGMFPFDDLRVYPTPEAHLYSVEELRLIYHAAAVYVQLAAMDANNFTVWTRHIPVLLRIGATHRYVMHALLAFSAMHIAYLTDCPLVARMALKHRGIALRGLQAAISSFSRETSDAILAASLVLSWQATDWQSWTQLMQGTLTVIKSMAAWQHESEFIDFIAETETITELPAFSNPEHRPLQPGPQDLESYREALEQILLLKEHLKQHSIEGTQVNSLVSFLKDIRKRPMLSAAQQFEYLQPLRTWLFWMPVGALQSSYESLNSLVVIAHLYTVALVMNNLFPDIGTGYFGSICLGPIEEIARHIFSSSIASPVQETFPTLTNLIEYPVEAVRKFRLRIGWPGRPEPMPCSPHFQPSDHLEVNQGQSYMPYGNPGFNYSSDSVSILISAGVSPQEAHSPLVLSSPFPGQQQYLNIPSPSFQVARISDRHSVDGSVSHSDGEEYGSYDMRGFHPAYVKQEDGYQNSQGVVYIHSQQPSPLLNPASGGMLSLPASPVSVSSQAFHPTQYVKSEDGYHNGHSVAYAPQRQPSPHLHPASSGGMFSLPASPTLSSSHEYAGHGQTPLMASGTHHSPLPQAQLHSSPTIRFGVFP